jgi:hypothetical protein
MCIKHIDSPSAEQVNMTHEKKKDLYTKYGGASN